MYDTRCRDKPNLFPSGLRLSFGKKEEQTTSISNIGVWNSEKKEYGNNKKEMSGKHINEQHSDKRLEQKRVRAKQPRMVKRRGEERRGEERRGKGRALYTAGVASPSKVLERVSGLNPAIWVIIHASAEYYCIVLC